MNTWLPTVSLGRFCGSALPPDLTSSGPVMTVLFVADEGVADSGFYASFKAMPLSGSECCVLSQWFIKYALWDLCESSLHHCFLLWGTCGPAEFACGSGECLHQDWLCDGWNDCADAADEHDCINSTYPPFSENTLQFGKDFSCSVTVFILFHNNCSPS